MSLDIDSAFCDFAIQNHTHSTIRNLKAGRRRRGKEKTYDRFSDSHANGSGTVAQDGVTNDSIALLLLSHLGAKKVVDPFWTASQRVGGPAAL